jgi:hypothetical protein
MSPCLQTGYFPAGTEDYMDICNIALTLLEHPATMVLHSGATGVSLRSPDGSTVTIGLTQATVTRPAVL